MELGDAETVFGSPHHPYTEALLSSVPQLEGQERPHPAAGRDPDPRRPAVGLCLPHALPALHRRRLQAGGAGAEGGRARPLLALPLLRRGAARAAAAAARGAPGGRDRRRRTAAAPSAGGGPEPERGGLGRCAEPGLKVRAAVLERVGAPLDVDRAGAGAAAGRARCCVRLHASGVCHSDLNAIDGTAPTPLPGRARPRGRRRGRGGRPRAWASRPARTSCSRGCRRAARCAECLRELPHLCRRRGRRWPPAACSTARRGCRATASRCSTTLPLLLRRAHRRARRVLRADPRRRAVRRRGAGRLRGHHRHGRRLAHRRRAARRPRAVSAAAASG